MMIDDGDDDNDDIGTWMLKRKCLREINERGRGEED
jgi:hypothetical protein